MDRSKSTLKKRTKRSAGEWMPAFLVALRNSANVRAACQAAGIDRKTAYNWRERADDFRKQWDEALEDACDILEAEAWKRAREGSDLLLIFLLKARRPLMYRETTRHEVTGANGKPISLKDVETTRKKRWAEVAPIIVRALTAGEIVENEPDGNSIEIEK